MPLPPRDHDQASASEMVPFTSGKISLIRSPLTMFIAFAAVIAPLVLILSGTLGEQSTLPDALKVFTYISFSSVFFVVFAVGMLIYFYTRPGKPLSAYAWSFVFTTLVMLPFLLGIPFILDLFILIFRAFAFADPGRLGPNAGVVETFIAHFIGAGMMEEAFKAIPILIGLMVALRAEKRPGPRSAATSFFAIRGPLDGVLLGIFAGAAFILVETAGQYLPNQVVTVMRAGGSFTDGVVSALLLYFPRVIGGAIGHIAYSGIVGYFIGLAFLRRKQMVPLILGGWLFASWLHALWNTSGTIDPSSYFFFVPAALSALSLVAVVLKARQLHVSRYGDAGDTMGSVIIDRSGGGRDRAPAMPGHYGQPYGQPPMPGYAPAPAVPPAPAAPYAGYAQNPAAPYAGYAQNPAPVPQPGYPPAPAPFAGYAANAPQPPAPVAPPAAPAMPEPPPTASETVQVPVTLVLAGRRIDLDAGTAMDFAADPVLAVLGAGVRGDVVPHPSRPGVLGLRNSGAVAWTAYLRDGSSQRIDRDQNVRLAPGVRIDFGGGLIGDIGPRG